MACDWVLRPALGNTVRFIEMLHVSVVCFSLVITLCGCGGSGGEVTPPSTANVTGAWAASVPNPIVIDSLVLTLVQDAADSVRGTGREIMRTQPGGASGETPLTVSGAVRGTSVRLIINGPPLTRPKDPELFVGALVSGSMHGQDYGMGVEVLGIPVVFHRQN